jgi:hypothetical protein
METVWISTASCIVGGASIGNDARLPDRSTFFLPNLNHNTLNGRDLGKNGEGGIRAFFRVFLGVFSPVRAAIPE